MNEFRFGGEVGSRPARDASRAEWTAYTYLRDNVAGEQREWWYHSYGCRRWFQAVRDTVTNNVRSTAWP